MSSCSSSSFFIPNRLTWVCYENHWWPAIWYDNYGQVLEQVGPRVSLRTKVQLSLAVLSSQQQRVAQLIGKQPMTFVPLYEEHIDFYQHLRQKKQQATKERYKQFYRDFHRGMDELQEYLTRADWDEPQEELLLDHVNHHDYHCDEDNVSVVSKSISEGDDDDEEELSQDEAADSASVAVMSKSPPLLQQQQQTTRHFYEICGTPVSPRDSWGRVWDKMRHSGWKWRANDDNVVYYIFPKGRLEGGIEGQDYLESLDQVQEYAVQHYGWNKQKAQEEEEETDDDEESSVEDDIQDDDESNVEDQSSNKKRALVESHNSSDEDDDDDYESFYVWKNLLSCLKHAGWKAVKARNPLHDWYYLPPGVTVQNGVLGVDYFSSGEHVMEYAKSIDFRGTYNSNNKKQRTSRETSETPEQKTQPQDPGIPMLSPFDDQVSESSDDEEEDRYEWKVLWSRLKDRGWKVVRASHVLHNWYYIRPGRKVKGGIMGVDYFATTTDVIEHERAADRNQAQEDTTSPMGLELEQEAKTMSTRRRPKQPHFVDTSLSTKKHWWKTQELPTFTKDIWPVLRDQLGFRYANGHYILPGVSLKNAKATGENPSSFGKDFFASEHDMRCYLCQHGIPNFHAVQQDDDDKENLLRWVTFCQVPVTPQTSISKLKDAPVLSCQDAWDLLSKKVGYSYQNNENEENNNGSICITPCRLAPQHVFSFESLEALRTFLRSSPTSDGSHAIPNLSRGQKKSLCCKISPQEDLRLRLWAATTMTPLPAYTSNERQQQQEQEKHNNSEEFIPKAKETTTSEETSATHVEEPKRGDGVVVVDTSSFRIQQDDDTAAESGKLAEEKEHHRKEIISKASAEEMETTHVDEPKRGDGVVVGSSSCRIQQDDDAAAAAENNASMTSESSSCDSTSNHHHHDGSTITLLLSTQPSSPQKSRRITMDPASFSQEDNNNTWCLN